MAGAADATDYLKMVDFPAHRDDIVHATEDAVRRCAGAPDVIKALRAMPPVEYGNKEDIRRSAHTET